MTDLTLQTREGWTGDEPWKPKTKELTNECC